MAFCLLSKYAIAALGLIVGGFLSLRYFRKLGSSLLGRLGGNAGAAIGNLIGWALGLIGGPAFALYLVSTYNLFAC